MFHSLSLFLHFSLTSLSLLSHFARTFFTHLTACTCSRLPNGYLNGPVVAFIHRLYSLGHFIVSSLCPFISFNCTDTSKSCLSFSLFHPLLDAFVFYLAALLTADGCLILPSVHSCLHSLMSFDFVWFLSFRN